MNPNFQIDLRHSAGNLHVHLLGEFNGMCAWELLKILKKHHRSGRVFVNTDDIRYIAGDGVHLFHVHMNRRHMRRDWLYFKGMKGFAIAPDGSRVLICNKPRKPMGERAHQTRPMFSVIR